MLKRHVWKDKACCGKLVPIPGFSSRMSQLLSLCRPEETRVCHDYMQAYADDCHCPEPPCSQTLILRDLYLPGGVRSQSWILHVPTFRVNLA